MKMSEAIQDARKNRNFSDTSEPVCVFVRFRTSRGKEDETELDLVSDDQETELINLWESLCEEMDSAEDLVESVEMTDYDGDHQKTLMEYLKSFTKSDTVIIYEDASIIGRSFVSDLLDEDEFHTAYDCDFRSWPVVSCDRFSDLTIIHIKEDE